jgi:hypothetical protein
MVEVVEAEAGAVVGRLVPFKLLAVAPPVVAGLALGVTGRVTASEGFWTTVVAAVAGRVTGATAGETLAVSGTVCRSVRALCAADGVEIGAGEVGFRDGSGPEAATDLPFLALRERRRIRWLGSAGFSKLSSAGWGEGSDEAAENE